MRMGRSARRGTAGIIAAVIMFGILFSVGTGYFIFVNGLNSSYAKGLVSSQSNSQNAAAEGLQVTTVLQANGDVGFFANNTAGESVNMTAVYVLSSTGILLKCDGVGLAPAAGCGNTTPALWIVVNVGKGSASLDTGYLYSAGDTDTVTVLSTRGNTFSATYPPTASQNSLSANTAQSLTVNPTTFKWTTIQPSPASLAQSKYTSNCNAAACGLGYTSSVTAGNTLVYGVGWYGQSAPATPTDTLGDTYTLGASNSVLYTYSPSVVQNRYASNCNAANCGLAYSSNVASGNVLVFGLGWYGQNPPSAPTDTRGDSFVLGASQSVTYNPPTPALVQNRYASNCNAANCALAYSSNVASGNTLVYALGWYGQSPPSTPTDTLGNAFTLGASNSVSVLTGTTSVVQNRYASNCNAANCGLAYSSNVASGNTLVYALGWYGQSPPSTPTDTRGSTFTLGASNSVAANGGTPSAVQSKYTSNCNSANCGLAYSSSVSVGNTLVFGLGWYANTLNYVPITITNNQGSATPTTFQQKVTWNPSSYSSYEAADLGNVRFCADSACVTTLYAWLESCTSSCTTSATSASAWVKLTSSIAGSGGTQTVYMAFYSTSTHFDGNYWGEAPTIPGTYGQNDNGANVFNLYDNFAGTSLNAGKWTVTKTGGGSVIVNNGVQFTTSGSSDYAFIGSATATYPYVTEASMTNRDGGTDPMLGETTALTANGCNTVGLYNGYEIDRVSGALNLNAQNSSGCTSVAAPSESFSPGIWQFVWSATGSQYGSDGNGVTASGSDSSITIANYRMYLGQSSSGNGNDNAQWTRTRAYPPGSVMPSTSFGSLNTGGGPSSVTDTLGDTFTLGVSQSVISGSYSYNSYIWYATASSTGADTVTASFSSSVTGSVSIYELNSVTVTSPSTSTGSSSSGSTSISVTSFTPATNSIVIGNAESASGISTYTAGAGYTLSGTCNSVYGCGEYKTGVGSATTVPLTLGSSAPWVEAAISFAPTASTTYYSYVWYATAPSSGADTITAAFGSTVTGSVSIFELAGVTITSPSSSTGSSSGGSTSVSVTSFTPSTNSIVIGNAESGTSTSTFTAAGGYTLAGACNSVYGCGESKTGVSIATTVPFTLSISAPWVESAISFGQSSTIFYSYIWYATSGSSGADTITAAFSSTVTGSVSIYEIIGYATSGALSSTGSSSTGSTSLSVTSFTPTTNSIVIGNAETSSSTSTYTAGSGFTLAGTCNSVYGCGESKTGVGTATTVSLALGTSSPWVESAMSFGDAPPITYYSYIWYATAASSGADTISASFSQSVAGSVSIYELNSATTTGIISSTGSSATAGSTSSVSSITPGANSLVIGNTEAGSNTFTAGAGYTLNAACSSVYGCSEYQTGVGSATTVPMLLSPGQPWVETALAFAPLLLTYYSYIWYATAASTGADTITATFSQTVTGSVSIYELNQYLTTGITTSTGSSAAGSTTSSVTSFTPGGSSIVIGNTETSSTSFTAGGSFTLVATCNSVYGCSEYQTAVSSSTTAPMTLNPSAPWVEVAIAFKGAPALQNGELVGGFPSSAIPYNIALSWRVQFTNQDSQGRSVTLWPKSLAAIKSIIQEQVEITPFFIVDGISSDGTTLIGYNTTHNFITIPYKSTVTVYFGSTTPLGTGTDKVDTNNEIAPFIGFFALEGIYSDKTLFGLTVPYPAGVVTQANAKSSPTAAANGATVSVTCTNPCNFGANSPGYPAYVGWMDSTGKITTVKTFTMTTSGNIPAGVTFQVPTAPAGYYTLVISDYVNTIYLAFQHT